MCNNIAMLPDSFTVDPPLLGSDMHFMGSDMQLLDQHVGAPARADPALRSNDAGRAGERALFCSIQLACCKCWLPATPAHESVHASSRGAVCSLRMLTRGCLAAPALPFSRATLSSLPRLSRVLSCCPRALATRPLRSSGTTTCTSTAATTAEPASAR